MISSTFMIKYNIYIIYYKIKELLFLYKVFWLKKINKLSLLLLFLLLFFLFLVWFVTSVCMYFCCLFFRYYIWLDIYNSIQCTFTRINYAYLLWKFIFVYLCWCLYCKFILYFFVWLGHLWFLLKVFGQPKSCCSC